MKRVHELTPDELFHEVMERLGDAAGEKVPDWSRDRLAAMRLHDGIAHRNGWRSGYWNDGTAYMAYFMAGGYDWSHWKHVARAETLAAALARSALSALRAGNAD